MTDSARIKAYAREIGFDLCGITEARLIPEAVAHYQAWLKAGYHADMRWLADTERRTNPKAVLPNAQSVIMLALNYYSSAIPEEQQGKVARYARGRDYHKVMEKMLRQLTNMLKQEWPHESYRFYVDYGPFSERTYAEQAGIGFIGKNGNIITKEFGSYVLLCEIITTKHLTYDTPSSRQCGSCSRCIDACPTSAIVAERTIDSNLCISYQTIENKTENIPDDIREKQSGWAFGCDICQEVCPFNNALRNKETLHIDFTPRYTALSREDPALMSDDAFLEKFQGTPLMRAKRSGILRNLKEH